MTQAHLAPFPGSLSVVYILQGVTGGQGNSHPVGTPFPFSQVFPRTGKPTKAQSAPADETQTCCHKRIQQQGREVLKTFFLLYTGLHNTGALIEQARRVLSLLPELHRE